MVSGMSCIIDEEMLAYMYGLYMKGSVVVIVKPDDPSCWAIMYDESHENDIVGILEKLVENLKAGTDPPQHIFAGK